LFKEYRKSFKDLFQILRLGKVKKSFLIASLILIFISISFEGLSFGLLFPLFKRLLEGSKTILGKELPLLGKILSFFKVDNFPLSTKLLIFAIVSAIFIRIISTYLSSLFILREGLRVRRNLRLLLYQHLLGLSNIFFDQKRSGEIYGILMNSTQRIEDTVLFLQQAILNLLFSLTYIFLLFFISWPIALLVLFILPIFFFIMKQISKKIEAISHKVLRAELDRSGLGVDVFSNIKLIKSFCTEEQEYERFSKLERFNEVETLRIASLRNSIPPLHELAVTLAITSLIVISLLWLKFSRSSLLIKLSIIILIVRRLSTSLSGFNYTVASFFNNLAHIEIILSALNREDKPIILGGKIPFRGIEKGIEFKNVSMFYIEGRKILKNISFFIPKGTVCALVGASGAGKTTIVELLPRFYEFQEGSIEIDGIDIREFELKSLRQNIAIVTQDTLVLNDSIYNNLIYGLDSNKVKREDVLIAIKKAHLVDFINSLPEGLNTLVGDKGVGLSGGELQRLSVARAILKDAPLLILDEATSSIDSISEHLIQQALYDLFKDRTVIVIAHRLSTIMHADKILVLEDGQIVESGKLQELLDKKGRFYEYWQAQRF
jgi:ABC-type multidrug transport system fused ATPase/permease subunit